jgi:hypothetical protein
MTEKDRYICCRTVTIYRDFQIDRLAGKQEERWTDRQTDRNTGRQVNRYTDRNVDR